MNGRKRHLLVDTGGPVMKAKVHPPLTSPIGRGPGRCWSGSMNLSRACAAVVGGRRVPRSGPKGADHRGRLGLSFEIVQRKPRWVWVPKDAEPDPIPAGFGVIRRRWVVERTFARILRNRRMSRDYELLPETGEAPIYVTMIRPMLERLAKGLR